MVVSCPYCGEAKSEDGLRGHVMLTDDEAHGRLGRLPDDFELPEGHDEWDALRDIDVGEESEGEQGGVLGGLRKRLG